MGENANRKTPAQEHRLQGYPYLAKFWAQSQRAMANRFSHLAILNILYLQAELYYLEDRWKEERKQDLSSGDTVRIESDWNWRKLSYSGRNEGGREQWKAALEIRKKLNEYYSAVLQYAQIVQLVKPTEKQRKEICKVLGSSSLSDGFGKFQSLDLAADAFHDPKLYGKPFAEDLMILDSSEEENDHLVRWIVHPLISLFHRIWRRRKNPIPRDLESAPEGENVTGLYRYSRNQVQGLSHIVGALVSAVMPLISMVILYFIQDMNTKVILVCAFTLVFCLAMASLSNARRIEIFAATAAFGSVQVVWISQNNPSNSHNGASNK